MQIIKNQSIAAYNLLHYKSNIKKSDILKLIRFMLDNIHVLNLETNGNAIFSLKNAGNEQVTFEVLIPVQGEVDNCQQFGYQPSFQLNNAVLIRHEGRLSDLDKTTKKLKEYLKTNNYTSQNGPYYIMIQEKDDNSNCIIDIYIDVKYNN